MAVTAVFTPALDMIGTAAATVAIGWIVGEARVRISPAMAVHLVYPPSKRAEAGVAAATVRPAPAIAIAAYFLLFHMNLIPCGNRVGLRVQFNVQLCLSATIRYKGTER
jgi:hypothetical protein